MRARKFLTPFGGRPFFQGVVWTDDAFQLENSDLKLAIFIKIERRGHGANTISAAPLILTHLERWPVADVLGVYSTKTYKINYAIGRLDISLPHAKARNNGH